MATALPFTVEPVPSWRDRLAAVDAWRRERGRGRLLILAVVGLIHLALLLALLLARTTSRPIEPLPTVVRLIPLPKPAAAPKPKATPKAVVRPTATKAPTPIVKVPTQPKPPPALFQTEMMEAVDIAKLPSHKSEQLADGAGTASAGTGTAAADDGYGPAVGTGPRGEKLFAAEWYREPTHGEIAPYLPKHLPDVSSADIICRTIERFGVEDCQEYGEQPAGTGLARAIRQAGWQFKVKPVRLGAKFEVGTWVRIRFTITASHDE